MNEVNTNARPEAETTIGQDVRALLTQWLRGRRGLVVLGLAATAIGLWFGWSSLVAAGIAPLLLLVLPCVGMFALGCFMARGGAGSGGSQGGAAGASGETTSVTDAKDPTRDA